MNDTCKFESAKKDSLSAASIRTYISKIRENFCRAEALKVGPLTRTGLYKLAECLFEDLDLSVWHAR